MKKKDMYKDLAPFGILNPRKRPRGPTRAFRRTKRNLRLRQQGNLGTTLHHHPLALRTPHALPRMG